MKKITSSKWLGTAALGLFVLSPISQALAETTSETLAPVLAPVIVTANRTAQTVDQSLASVTLITREEIERLQPASLTDLLRSRAGIDVASSGSFGKQTSIYSRGSSSKHTLLLVDGVRMGSASAGGAAWQHLPPSEIERIEIVRGPRTSLYGSDAVGGVIQVFTRRGVTGDPKVNAFVGGGSNGTNKVGASIAGGTENFSYSLGASRFETDGIDVTKDGDKDGYDNLSVSTNLEYRLSKATSFQFSLLTSHGETEYDSLFDPGGLYYDDYSQSALRLAWNQQFTSNWGSEFSLAQSYDKQDNYAPYGDSYFNTRKDQIAWINTLQLGIHELQVGVDAVRDNIDSSTQYDEDSRDNLGVFAQMHVPYGNLTGDASVRYDDNEQFGSKTTGQLALGYWLASDLNLRSSVGTAFVTPTFNDLYYPADPVWGGGGNPDLKPEKSTSYELGLHYSPNDFFFDAAVFYTDTKDLIVYDFATNKVQNTNKAEVTGLEIESGLKLEDWTLNLAATFLKPEDKETKKDLPRRAKNTLRVDLDRHWQDVDVGVSILSRGASYDDANNTKKLDSHLVVDLRASWEFYPSVTLRTSVQNLQDKEYSLAKGYYEVGRAAYLTLEYKQ